ncbi:MAG: hypothetical protein GX896_07725 [Clostridiales bacterium]|nr:hypothetical protein [Clostridiales bacterium]
MNNPNFAPAVNIFNNQRAKQVKDLERRYAKYTQRGITLDKEMIETLNFYKDL